MPKRKPGRPQHRPTKKLREKVEIAAGGGMAHENIALALGITRNTLEKHYARELTIGAAERRLEVMQALRAAAKKGRVAAIKLYLEHEPQIAVPPAPKPEAKPEAKPAPLGKKEQAQQDAVGAQAGTDWEKDLAPRRTLQ